MNKVEGMGLEPTCAGHVFKGTYNQGPELDSSSITYCVIPIDVTIHTIPY